MEHLFVSFHYSCRSGDHYHQGYDNAIIEFDIDLYNTEGLGFNDAGLIHCGMLDELTQETRMHMIEKTGADALSVTLMNWKIL